MHMIKILEALADKTRLTIIEYLLKNKKCKCICHITNYVKKDPSNVLRHVLILKKVGVVSTHKEGKFLFCCLKE